MLRRLRALARDALHESWVAVCGEGVAAAGHRDHAPLVVGAGDGLHPRVRVQLGAGEAVVARADAVDEGQRAHPPRLVDRDVERDAAAHRVRDEHDIPQPQPPQQGCHVGGQLAAGVAGRRCGRAAVAPQIDADNAMPTAEGARLRRPVRARAQPAVYEDEGGRGGRVGAVGRPLVTVVEADGARCASAA